MSQPQPERTFVEMPGAAGEALSFNRDICRQLCFGISLSPIALADLGVPGSSRHAALRNDVRRLDRAEAVELLVARVSQKAAAAIRAGEERLQLFRAGLHRIKDGAGGELLAVPAVREALDAAMAAASAPPASPAPPDVAALKAQLAALASQIDRIEAQGNEGTKQ